MDTSDIDGVITPHLQFADNGVHEQAWPSSQAFSQREITTTTPAVVIDSPLEDIDPHNVGIETPDA